MGKSLHVGGYELIGIVFMLRKLPEVIQEARASLNVLNASQAKQALANREVLLIDVREVSEVSSVPIDGAISIPRGILEPQMLTRYGDESLVILLFCASGVRATFAAEQLIRLGYSNVSIITDKIEDIAKVFNR